MATKKRKKQTTSKKTNTRKKQNELEIDLAVVSMIIISILLAVLIYTSSGYIGKTLSPLLGGIIGWMKYIIPIGTFAIAINLACEKKQTLSPKLVQYVIFLMSIAVIMCIYQMSVGNIDVNGEFAKVLQQSYELGEKNIGGGSLGAMFAVPIISLLGTTGAVILSIGIAILVLIFMFGIHPSKIITNTVENIEERRQARQAYYEELDEEVDEKAEEIIENRKDRINKKELRKNNKKQSIDIPLDDDEITINLHDKKEKRKYDYEEDDLFPLGMEKNKKKFKSKIDIDLFEDEKKGLSPNELEANLFKDKNKMSSPNELEANLFKDQKKQSSPNELEANLFKTEEPVKEDKSKEVLVLEHAVTVEDENYEFPPIELLSLGEVRTLKGGKKAIADNATNLQKTLYSFGVSAKVENVSVGPAITRYELKPAEGVRVNKIANLADDIALNLAAESIRIEAPIPGKQAVGIEVPNKEREMVHLRDIIQTDTFMDYKSNLAFALGKDVAGNEVVTDIAKMPHVLIAGSTGSGKSVCINTLITSIIYKAKPSEVKLLMVDPKVVELSVYNGIPHLLIPVVTDPKKAAGALAWAVQEMVNRYSLFAGKNVRDIKGYNEAIEKEGQAEKLPQIVVIIDELADLMMVAAKDVEDAICRLAQMARAAGMHLVIATQRPSVDVITGIIKANIPSRIAFAVSSQVDSRTILDSVGAEKLLGKGDMLFYPSGAPKPTRLQGAFVDDKEVEKIVDFLKSNGEVQYSEDIIEAIGKSNSTDKELEREEGVEDDADPFLNDAIETVIETGQASTSFIQRRFKVGYARAGRIIDQMEERGIISGYEGSKPRQVLMSKERWQELNMAKTPSVTEGE